jgi:hypothetical protein
MLLALLAGCAGDDQPAVEVAANVTVDVGLRYQTWSMWTALNRRWDAPHMYYGPEQGEPLDLVPAEDQAAILDLVYTDLAQNGFELVLQGGSQDPSFNEASHDWLAHEQENDNDDPFDLDASALVFDYWIPFAAIAQEAVERIEARGVQPALGLRVSNVPAWMSAEGSANAEEYAEWVTALVLHLQDEYGLALVYISVNNEPEGNGVGPDVLAERAVALESRLRSLNLDTRVAAPETVTPGDADTMGYLDALESTGAASDLLYLNYHAYDNDPSVGTQANLEARALLADFAAEHGALTYFSEQSDDVKANRRTYWNDTPEQALAWAEDLVREMTVTQISAYCQQWNFWSNTNENLGSSAYVTVLLGDAASGYEYLGYETPAFYDTLRVFVNSVTPGMVRVDASTDLPDVGVVAWLDDTDGRLVVIAVNSGASDATVALASGESGTVPAGGALALQGYIE